MKDRKNREVGHNNKKNKSLNSDLGRPYKNVNSSITLHCILIGFSLIINWYLCLYIKELLSAKNIFPTSF